MRVVVTFEEATNIVSEDSYVTVSLVIPLVVETDTSLQELGLNVKSETAKIFIQNY